MGKLEKRKTSFGAPLMDPELREHTGRAGERLQLRIRNQKGN